MSARIESFRTRRDESAPRSEFGGFKWLALPRAYAP
jgi:hypothetical protein